jgi:head-tail adaptor
MQPLDPVGGDDRSTAYRVEGRYHPQITVETRIVYGSLELFVRGVQNVNTKGREIRLYCEHVAP